MADKVNTGMKAGFSIKTFLAAGLVAVGMLLSPQLSAAEETPALQGSSDKILSALSVDGSDIKHYKRAFRYLENNNFKNADKEIDNVDNNLLLGVYLAEKYLSDKYTSSFKELVKWLKKYNNLPQADKIYRLAQKKRPKNNKQEIPFVNKTRQKPSSVYSWMDFDMERFSPAEQKFIRVQTGKFRQAVNKGKTKAARIILENKRFRRLVSNRELDSMAGTLATAYLMDNYDKQAYQWASAAAVRSKNATAAWIAGLSAWRMKQYKNSARNFAILADSGNSDEWLVGAGSYWAYRANERLKRKNEARKYLHKASKYNRTFYGILANYQLGNPIEYDWSVVAYLNDFSQDAYLKEITTSGALSRAIVLLHAKQPKLAEKELRYAMMEMTPQQMEIAMFLARQNNMHSLGAVMAKRLEETGGNQTYQAALYPVPHWEPAGGWKVSKPLVLAFSRQESTFNPEAVSAAGAHGLMQLLPSTAVHITQNKSLRRNKKKLLEAEYNLAIGQRYINYLLEKPFIEGNLFYLMTAYNAGPGNLLKWQKKMRYNNDPLLFIEVLPARETRIYIERVMANLWIYQSRFGQELSGIDALSKDEWPMIKDD